MRDITHYTSRVAVIWSHSLYYTITVSELWCVALLLSDLTEFHQEWPGIWKCALLQRIIHPVEGDVLLKNDPEATNNLV